MKNIFWIACIIASICTTTLHAQDGVVNGKRIYFTENEHADFENLRLRQKQQSTFVSQLIDNGLLDSAMNYCTTLYNADSMSSFDYDIRMATIYWLKGEQETAYDIVMKNTDYSLKTSGGTGNPFWMLYDYELALPLTTDTLLRQMVINKVSDFYMAYDYPEGDLGLKLILLNYKNEKLQAKHLYEVSLCKTDSAKEQVDAQYKSDVQEINQTFKNLLETNKGLFTEYQIGLPYQLQFDFIFQLPTLQEHQYFQPYLKDALVAKKIEPNVYIDELINIERLKYPDKSEENLEQMRDSFLLAYDPTIDITITKIYGDTLLLSKHFKDGKMKVDTMGTLFKKQ